MFSALACFIVVPSGSTQGGAEINPLFLKNMPFKFQILFLFHFLHCSVQFHFGLFSGNGTTGKRKCFTVDAEMSQKCSCFCKFVSKCKFKKIIHRNTDKKISSSLVFKEVLEFSVSPLYLLLFFFVEPLNHPLLSGASSFTKHAAVLISNTRDGFINIGKDAPGKPHRNIHRLTFTSTLIWR